MSRPRTILCKCCGTPLAEGLRTRVKPLVVPVSSTVLGLLLPCPTCGVEQFVTHRAADRPSRAAAHWLVDRIADHLPSIGVAIRVIAGHIGDRSELYPRCCAGLLPGPDGAA